MKIPDETVIVIGGDPYQHGEAQTARTFGPASKRLIYIQFLCQPNAYALSPGHQKTVGKRRLRRRSGLALKMPTIETCESRPVHHRESETESADNTDTQGREEGNHQYAGRHYQEKRHRRRTNLQ